MKKILSLVLVLALVLGSFSFAFATAPADVVDTDYEEAVETLMALGIVNGYPDGTYRPANVVTRAEMAKLLIVALGYEELSGGAASFSDTAGHWAEGYIALATGLGIVQGYPDGTFKPDATVSFDEAVTMILRALGYTDDSLTGAWPTNYKIKALNLDLLDGVSLKAAGADRGAVALMLYNALELEYGDVDADDVWNTSEMTLLSKMGDFVEGYTFTYADLYDEDDALDTAIDLTDYLFFNVDYYENADGEIAYISEINSETIVGDAETGGVGGLYSDALYVTDADDEEYTVYTSGAGLYFNWALTYSVWNFDETEVTVVWLDQNDNGDYDNEFDEVLGVIGNKVTDLFVVDEDGYVADDFEIDAKHVDYYVLPTTTDDDDETVLDTDKVVVMGAVDTLEDLEEYDVVEVYEADESASRDKEPIDKVTLNVVRDVVEGLYSEYDDYDGIIVVDGESLEISETWRLVGDSVSLGDDVMALLDSNGEVVALYLVEEAEATTAYAVVTGIADQDIDEDDFGDEEVVLGQVRLLVESGDQIIYDVEEDLFSTSLTALFVDGDLVEYALNSDGEITELTTPSGYGFPISWTYDADLNFVSSFPGDFFLADDVIIFDLTAEEIEDYDVIAPTDLGDNITAGGILDTDSEEVTVMVLTESDADVEEDTVYAVIVDVTVVLDPDDEDQIEQALKVMALVDGELTTLYTEEGDTELLSPADEDDFAVLLLEDGRIADATSRMIHCYTTVQAVGANYIKVGDSIKLLADDVVVYVVTVDDLGDLDTIEAGTMADVEVDSFIDVIVAQNTVNDDDEITVLIVCEEDMGGDL